MQSLKISTIIKEELKDKEEIIAVYIFGSYLYNPDCEDIDVGILLKESFNPGHLYEIKLQKSLEKAITEKKKRLPTNSYCIIEQSRFKISLWDPW